MIKVTALGAAETVTGSNFLIETSQGNCFVVDCGLFQGSREMDDRNWDPWGFDPKAIKHLILTHAHVDHCGRIPKLVKDGFRGKIVTSPPTTELCEIMLLDSAHVQEMEAQWRTRRNRRRAKHRVDPLYTTKDAEQSLRYFVPTEMNQIVELEPGIKVRLRNAGHVLGSSIVELWVEDGGKDTKIVFSGDLGRQDQLIVEDPAEIHEGDFVFIESTYGNRLHRSLEESKAEFLHAIQYATAHQEKVIIPAFALERTQEVLYILGEFFRAGKLPDIPIYLDSPLAIRATSIFRRNKQYYDENARALLAQGHDPFYLPNLRLTPSTQESMAINDFRGSAIIISANGMCNAGRIKHHLKHNLWRSGASIVIVGFQAQGSTGRQIVDGAQSVTIFGEKIAVRAKVFTIGGLSAHGDQADLLRWVGHFTERSKPRVLVIHGEPLSSEALAKAIRERFGLSVSVPRWREVLRLEPQEGPREILPVPTPPVSRQATLELIGEVEKEIARLKEQLIANQKAFSADELEKLRDVRDDLETLVLR